MKSHKSKPIQFFISGLGFAVLLTCSALAADPYGGTKTPSTPGKASSEASSFIKEAYQANANEIALAQLAEQKSENAEVKQFAEMVEKDHKQANDKLRTIAQSHGVALEQTPDAKQERQLEKFQKMSGAEFDKEFSKEMLRGHQKAIAKYEKAEQKVSDPEVKQYITATLPTLREHQQQAKQTAQAAGVDSATISSLTKKESTGMGGTGDDTEKETGHEGQETTPPQQQP
jgi:putative membrane protein